MAGSIRAVAIDYDGTLTLGRRPSRDVLDALAEARSDTPDRFGLRALLVTGRILGELWDDFPDAAEHFDAIVAENGAVLFHDGLAHSLTAPVSLRLDEALVAQGISFRRGRVLLACRGEHDLAITRLVRQLGLDLQLVRNRSELMVLPAGITKGTGVAEAADRLNLSPHNIVGVGDAENDHSLLAACEIGVAVANAVDSLKQGADVVLERPADLGVLDLLRGPVLRDELRVEPRRWTVAIGSDPEGGTVAIPSSRMNLLVTGGSGSGKSNAAGLLVERLVELGYSVCVFDPEGDHGALARLSHVVLVGGRDPLPTPAQLSQLCRQLQGGVIVDLTLHDDRPNYVRDALAALEATRRSNGIPHWIVIDEAHVPLGIDGLASNVFSPERKGYCLVTYQPQWLCGEAAASFDLVMALAGRFGIDREIGDTVATLTGVDPEALAPARTGKGLGHGILVRTGEPESLRPFVMGRRWVEHVRHWHKYAEGKLPAPKRFYFRDRQSETGAVAANLGELHHELRRCRPLVLRHHAGGADFSRWIEDVIQDLDLARQVAEAEKKLLGADDAEVGELLEGIVAAIERRYVESAPDSD